ncbi:hypothetical protein BJ875DRAFT_507265 [Amylocarpus encephaloides]|uniref:SMP-30/Gluconolactonase/LRE-like region domain-containing protein n=1 Tax=Amylocarpus encephaloides TaxID=45428 RepID=A0A9P7YCD4_9HELO|nr:hypothetical protein BJ875DRAFT_507265 [Amylocarpus encephaloides]
MAWFLTFLQAAIGLSVALARPSVDFDSSTSKSRCPPFKGDIVINQYQLYPENADLILILVCYTLDSCLWNSTVAVYDPYKDKVVDILEFPGITRNPEFHIGGVDVNQDTGLVSIVVDAGAAFNTGGVDISGTNYIMLWDPKAKTLLYKFNITQEVTRGTYGGFQDAEQDPDGNVYVVGTYPGSIVKVDKRGQGVTPWYLNGPPIVPTNAGLNGLAATGWTLLTNDFTTASIYRFDMRAKKGTPIHVPISHGFTFKTFTDAIYLPPKYHGTVLLVAEVQVGVQVLRSKNAKWEKAEYMGLVPWDGIATGIFVTASVQVGEGVYMVLCPAIGTDPIVPGTLAGNRTEFLMPDITRDVERLLRVRGGWD